ncbi:DUF4124 domain-containing protein [Marinobacterium rhizophilum]|uniref:DUF4124 domain-containing protein n=1 Tax=Marinobacterium rhizophilum TaxID=420402 RepID=A0ABY5HGZ3_9GAMM|nr:DUF4124 domain-containing protein [Marinobacterium rhizophilum]UTW11513.1 DUF4124 domain-containing protein [Marinobacterium rhizophilum]
MADPIYRWRDDRGVLHFSGVPPVGVEVEEVRPGRISVVSMPPARPAEPDCDPGAAEPCEVLPVPGKEASAAPGPLAEPDAVAEVPDRERRRDTLGSRSQRLRDYDRRERIGEIRSRREATRRYERDKPKTVSQQLRERAEGRAP